jgi:hypothetical protein
MLATTTPADCGTGARSSGFTRPHTNRTSPTGSQACALSPASGSRNAHARTDPSNIGNLITTSPLTPIVAILIVTNRADHTPEWVSRTPFHPAFRCCYRPDNVVGTPLNWNFSGLLRPVVYRFPFESAPVMWCDPPTSNEPSTCRSRRLRIQIFEFPAT